MWDHPRPGIEPVSPALAGRFLTTGPPGKSLQEFFLRGCNRVSGFERLHIVQEISSSSILLFLVIKATSLVAQLEKNLPAMQVTKVQSLSWGDPMERESLPTLGFLSENPMDSGAWRATYSPWGCKE